MLGIIASEDWGKLPPWVGIGIGIGALSVVAIVTLVRHRGMDR